MTSPQQQLYDDISRIFNRGGPIDLVLSEIKTAVFTHFPEPETDAHRIQRERSEHLVESCVSALIEHTVIPRMYRKADFRYDELARTALATVLTPSDMRPRLTPDEFDMIRCCADPNWHGIRNHSVLSGLLDRAVRAEFGSD